MKTTDRFETAQQWIQASASNAPDKYAGHLATICVKRKGVWSVRRSVPKSGTDKRVIYDAFKHARHARQWGDLASWKDGTTANLFNSTEEQRDLFDYIFDTTMELAR